MSKITVATATTLAVAAAFTAGMVIGGQPQEEPGASGPTSPGVAGPDVSSDPIRLTGSGRVLAPTGDCDHLLAVYVDKGVEQVGPAGWGNYWGPAWGLRSGMPATNLVEDSRAVAADRAQPLMSGQSNSATGTNVQEAGVDEPDHVKTDGERLFRITRGRITAYDVTGAAPVEVGELKVTALPAAELLLVGDRLVVIGEASGNRWERQGTAVTVLDVTDPASMTVISEQTWSATLVTARQHGHSVRLLAQAGLPELDFRQPRRQRGYAAALEHNRDLIRATTIDDWLPTVTTRHPDGTETTERLVDCDEVSVPDDDSGLDTLVVAAFDALDPDTVTRSGLVTGSDLAYFSHDRMYLATGGWWRAPVWPIDVVGRGRIAPQFWDDHGRTYLHAFTLDGLSTRYLASGEVKGRVADRWSMDAADGVLRVAVGATEETGNFNSVITLTEDGAELVEVGRVDKLGVNEDIKSVRWFDEMAVLVTFRTVDPLYVIDLRDATAPVLLGELKIPGFSEYLHPLGGRRIIGVGQDANERNGRLRGAQVALFDLADMTDPKRVSTIKYDRGTQAGAGRDPRQFTWLPGRRTALTVISDGWRGRTGWVSVLEVRGGRLHDRLVEVEYGRDIDRVRLMPVNNGQVVLVTGDEVAFLDL
ncbi:beta-propeller domain-containing protein [Nocardioides limicola]|uniref:beta-propeller domain-containing protein n=1 Tax=Nocardioides limicola TaxID=2803368 RepID=UPI00193C75F9|nr:beta-propeller domain-containing protein [Nocardioides sp. DJM-14]